MNANLINNEQTQSVIALTPVQSSCCAPAPAASACCEPGNIATVVNPAGQTVSACCGKPVNTESKSTACCG